MSLFKKKDDKPEYLEHIEELDHLTIVYLKGVIDAEMVAVIEDRIQSNRRQGSKIDKNVLVDYSKVTDVDSATVALHLMRLKEYEAQGFKIGFINPSKKLMTLLDMFHQSKAFKVYDSPQQAIVELNVVNPS